jgi:amine acid ABC transporter, permease protein, 3-TM region, His/Glu/Gln/Arg/opine family
MLANFERVWSTANLERFMTGDLLSKGVVGGLALTLILSVLAIVFSTILGTIIALMRQSRSPLISAPAIVYVQIMRNIPVLILMFWVYFLPPQLFAIETSPFLSVTVALTLFSAAYIAEILRGGMRALPAGAAEAAHALGMGRFATYAYVILPHAFHTMLPALVGRYIVTVKNTSIAFLIGLADVTEIGRQISSRLMTAPVEVYLTLMIIYFVVNRLLSLAAGRLENKRRFGRIFLRF